VTQTAPVTQTATATTAAELTAYLTAASELVGQFDLVLNSVDGLLAEVKNNNALITDAAWTTRMNAALTTAAPNERQRRRVDGPRRRRGCPAAVGRPPPSAMHEAADALADRRGGR
jgi:hypothetical protein